MKEVGRETDEGRREKGKGERRMKGEDKRVADAGRGEERQMKREKKQIKEEGKRGR